MNVVMLGSGNVATHLTKAIYAAGHQIVQIFSRTIKNAEILAHKVNATSINDLKLIAEADIYIISVADDAIAELISNINLGDKLVIHTSGSTAIDILKGISTRIGVLYPLQTFSKQNEVDFQTLPFAIEGNSEQTILEIECFASSFSKKIIYLNSSQRLALHIAAVFACNFTNHCYAIAEYILKKENLDFDLLRPLINETANKIKNHSPINVQTGPAVRKDKSIILKHQKYLSESKELKKLYALLSQSIINLHSDN